jgi:hypothetical protein
VAGDAEPQERGSSQAQRRAALRAYVRWTLYAEAPARQTAPALSLPRLDTAVVSEADVYAARPGSDDPRLDPDGRPRPRAPVERRGVPTLGRGPTSHDPVGMQAGNAGAWRRYLQDELTNQPATLQFERDTVKALVQRLSPRDQQAIWDIGNRVTKEAATAHRCSPGAIKLAAKDALDRLLALLYASPKR